uniref:Reverse transcriptase domain-containing protein n=1 Tax=Sinocyclocheilus anshuiensis TaxID=1608454 RepID=A0A671NWB5_9TELE
MIQILYETPLASVITGTCQSLPFPLQRGCPLSPFALSLEPLAQAIREHKSIYPIVVHGSKHSISLYADDILFIILYLQCWNTLPISLQGRISIVKMNILPRLNFLFFMIPISPPKFLEQTQSLISKFIWNNKRARIKSSTLQRTKLMGGLSLPNFKLYYWAFQLKALRVWMDENCKVLWKSIETALIFHTQI